MERILYIYSTKQRAKYEFRQMLSQKRSKLSELFNPTKYSIVELRIENKDKIIEFTSNDCPECLRGKRFNTVYIDQDLKGVRQHPVINSSIFTGANFKWIENEKDGTKDIEHS
jgi:hypothetical protein